MTCFGIPDAILSWMKMLKQRYVVVTVVRIVNENISKNNNNEKASLYEN